MPTPATRTIEAHNGDITLVVHAEGPPDAPRVVLVSGLGSTSQTWSRRLVDPLLGAGFQVVRFDNRDVGHSTRVPATNEYDLTAMGADLLAVVDATGVPRAHVLGRSLGGAIAIEAALAAPDRIASLVLVYTSAALDDPVAAGLPRAEEWVLEQLAEAAFTPPAVDTEARILRRLIDAELYCGTRYPLDRDEARAQAAEDVAYAPDRDHGHGLAVALGPSRVDDLGRLGCPVLVLHGTADPMVPIEHGRLLAERIPGAQMIEYEGLGHEMPGAWCDEIAAPVVAHLRAAEA